QSSRHIRGPVFFPIHTFSERADRIFWNPLSRWLAASGHQALSLLIIFRTFWASALVTFVDCWLHPAIGAEAMSKMATVSFSFMSAFSIGARHKITNYPVLNAAVVAGMEALYPSSPG